MALKRMDNVGIVVDDLSDDRFSSATRLGSKVEMIEANGRDVTDLGDQRVEVAMMRRRTAQPARLCASSRHRSSRITAAPRSMPWATSV